VLASGVPEPSGFAILVQTIYAEDYPGRTVTFRGLTGPGSSDWTCHEAAMDVPGDAGVIRFGISLAGRGRVELRNAELPAARPEAGE
jgi:hypothetical protein